jgi:hypothetical protein
MDCVQKGVASGRRLRGLWTENRTVFLGIFNPEFVTQEYLPVSGWNPISLKGLEQRPDPLLGIVPKRADYAIFKLTLGKIQPAPS